MTKCFPLIREKAKYLGWNNNTFNKSTKVFPWKNFFLPANLHSHKIICWKLIFTHIMSFTTKCSYNFQMFTFLFPINYFITQRIISGEHEI